ARRYGLFALVGIAGEDDLDAPDVDDAKAGPVRMETSVAPSIAGARQSSSGNGSGKASLQRASSQILRPILPPDESARLRQGMLAEIESIGSSEAATAWANTMLRTKNSLIADDAHSVEFAFEAK